MTDLPEPFTGFRDKHLDLAQANEALGNAAQSAGFYDE